MKVLLTGGGSGGHITPLLAVAAEIRTVEPDVRITYIGQRNDKVARSVAGHPAIDSTHAIWAGKLRRYHGEGWRQLLDVKTLFFNVRDVFYTIFGIVQSLWIVGWLRPDVLFIKGGYVSVPVGIAAAVWRVPFVTHDSDAVAGLANRLVARWAVFHAVGMPAELYAYPPDKTKMVGVPIALEYKHVQSAEQAAYKKLIGLPEDARVVFVTGGGLGARSLNNAVISAAQTILAKEPHRYIVHLTGHKLYDEVQAQYAASVPSDFRDRIVIKDFVTDLYNYSGAADLIVTRAGATSIAEFAMQGKACIIVPNPVLAGGHQIHNAKAYERAGAVVVVSEADVASRLGTAVETVLENTDLRIQLGEKLHMFANPHAARDLAEIICRYAKKRQGSR